MATTVISKALSATVRSLLSDSSSARAHRRQCRLPQSLSTGCDSHGAKIHNRSKVSSDTVVREGLINGQRIDGIIGMDVDMVSVGGAAFGTNVWFTILSSALNLDTSPFAFCET